MSVGSFLTPGSRTVPNPGASSAEPQDICIGCLQAVRYRRWRNTVGPVDDPQVVQAGASTGAVQMSAGELFTEDDSDFED
jgi:hypothetical protein